MSLAASVMQAAALSNSEARPVMPEGDAIGQKSWKLSSHPNHNHRLDIHLNTTLDPFTRALVPLLDYPWSAVARHLPFAQTYTGRGVASRAPPHSSADAGLQVTALSS